MTVRAGLLLRAALGAALDQSFDQIIRDLRTQYLLAFYPHGVPPAKDRFHALDIAVTQPELQVKARSGYYGEVRRDTPVAPAAPAPGSDSIRAPKPPQPKQPRSSQN